MNQKGLAVGFVFLATFFGTHDAYSQVQAGSQAPMFRGVDENMRLIDTAGFVDGTPLLFLYTSAT